MNNGKLAQIIDRRAAVRRAPKVIPGRLTSRNTASAEELRVDDAFECSCNQIFRNSDAYIAGHTIPFRNNFFGHIFHMAENLLCDVELVRV